MSAQQEWMRDAARRVSEQTTMSPDDAWWWLKRALPLREGPDAEADVEALLLAEIEWAQASGRSVRHPGDLLQPWRNQPPPESTEP